MYGLIRKNQNEKPNASLEYLGPRPDLLAKKAEEEKRATEAAAHMLCVYRYWDGPPQYVPNYDKWVAHQDP